MLADREVFPFISFSLDKPILLDIESLHEVLAWGKWTSQV